MNNVTPYSSMMKSLATLSSSQNLVFENISVWNDETIEQLNKLVKLRSGWDGYQAQPVSFENAHFAMQMLQSVCRNNTPAPQIVPGVSGDLQIEWHTLDSDVELHVLAPNHVNASFSRIGENPIEIDLVLTFDFTTVVNWVGEIMETPIAIVAAAA